MLTNAADQWTSELAGWEIPAHILESAPRRPFVFPSEMFAPPPAGQFPLSIGGERAAEALGDGGTVLDVGCGGGAAGFALVPPATALIGTDRQADMTAAFAATAAKRGVPCETVTGSWPEIAGSVPTADIVVSNNVLYNVPDLLSFAKAAHAHARRRVVFEITADHPQTNRAPMWKHFWGIDRPSGPTAFLAAAVLSEAGFDVQVELSNATERDAKRAAPVTAAFWTRQCCLPADREPEVVEFTDITPFPTERVVIWWDTQTRRDHGD